MKTATLNDLQPKHQHNVQTECVLYRSEHKTSMGEKFEANLAKFRHARIQFHYRIQLYNALPPAAIARIDSYRATGHGLANMDYWVKLAKHGITHP